jgi:hypothetical protein
VSFPTEQVSDLWDSPAIRPRSRTSKGQTQQRSGYISSTVGREMKGETETGRSRGTRGGKQASATPLFLFSSFPLFLLPRFRRGRRVILFKSFDYCCHCMRDCTYNVIPTIPVVGTSLAQFWPGVSINQSSSAALSLPLSTPIKQVEFNSIRPWNNKT